MYQKRNKELEILKLYRGNYKKQLYLRQISKLSKLPLKTTQNTLIYLEKIKIMKSRTEGKNKYFTLNLENIQTKLYMLQAEIYTTENFLENFPQFKTFLKSITINIPIILFGSFARFTADKNSDIDFLIIAEKEPFLPFHLLANKVHKINISEKSFIKAIKEKENLIKEIEETHIILNNYSFYINAMWENYGK